MDLFSLLSTHPHYRPDHTYEHSVLRNNMTDLEQQAAEQSMERRHLEQRVKSLEAACAGLWTLLKERLDCTDDDLLVAINHSQAVKSPMVEEHGTLTHCPACQKKLLSRTAAKCSWCGATI